MTYSYPHIPIMMKFKVNSFYSYPIYEEDFDFIFIYLNKKGSHQ